MIFTCANSATNICEGFLNDGYNQKYTEKILGKRIDMMRQLKVVIEKTLSSDL